MPSEHIRRPRRNPLSPEEVAEIIALKRRQAHIRLHKFRKTRYYKLLNVFNVLCFFLYLEILFCFAGPCRYASHTAVEVQPHYGQVYKNNGEAILDDVVLISEAGRKYVFVIRDFVPVPADNSEFFVGKDFLLGKELKGFLEDEDKAYRLFAASPVLFLSALVLVASLLAFVYNLNQHAYSLGAVSVLNTLTFLAIACY